MAKQPVTVQNVSAAISSLLSDRVKQVVREEVAKHSADASIGVENVVQSVLHRVRGNW